MLIADKALWKGPLEGQNIFASEGSHVTLECDVSINPWGHFEWEFNGGELPTNIVKSDNTLTVLSVDSDNFGRYNCIAINQLMGANHTVSFEIDLRTPGPPGQPANTTVEASTSVSVTLGWTCGHNGGDDYMWFELYICNTTTGEFEVYDENIPADCSIGERNVPDYRVDGLESETEHIFRIDSVNRFGTDVIASPLNVKYTTTGRSSANILTYFVPSNNYTINFSISLVFVFSSFSKRIYNVGSSSGDICSFIMEAHGR